MESRLLRDEYGLLDPHGIATVMIDASGFGNENVDTNMRATICESASLHAGWLSHGRLDELKAYLGLKPNQSLQDSFAWQRCNNPTYVGEDVDNWLDKVGHKKQDDDAERDFVDNMQEEDEDDDLWDDAEWE